MYRCQATAQLAAFKQILNKKRKYISLLKQSEKSSSSVLAKCHLFTNGCSAVNGCRQNESPVWMRVCFCLVNGAWSVQISLLIQIRTRSHFRKHYYGLWTLCILVKNVVMLDLFLVFSRWTGVVWIAVWTLILTAPIHCRASIGEHVM